MPTYQYTCTTCDHDLEAVQSFTDDPLTECPECSGRLRKVFSAVGVVFKGSGFYRTDSRTDKGSGSGTGKGKSSNGSTGSGGSSNSGGKSETSASASSGSGTSTSGGGSKESSKANTAA